MFARILSAMAGRAYFAIAHSKAEAGAQNRLKELEAKRAGLQKLVETRWAEKTSLERLVEFLHFDIQSTGQKSHCVTTFSGIHNALKLEDTLKAHREAQLLLAAVENEVSALRSVLAPTGIELSEGVLALIVSLVRDVSDGEERVRIHDVHQLADAKARLI